MTKCLRAYPILTGSPHSVPSTDINLNATASCNSNTPSSSTYLQKHSFQTRLPQTQSGKASSGSATSSLWTPASYCFEEPGGTQRKPFRVAQQGFISKQASFTVKPVGVSFLAFLRAAG